MMQPGMGVIHAQRMFLCRNVVAQYQIQFKFIVPLSCNRRDRIVRLAFRLGKYKRLLVSVAPLRLQNYVRKSHQPV